MTSEICARASLTCSHAKLRVATEPKVSRVRMFWIGLLCLCVLPIWAAPVVAEPLEARGSAREQNLEARGSAREQDDDKAYKDLIEQALAEFRLKNWPEARVFFRKAHELSPNARTLRGLGVVSFEMRDYQQAVQHLSAALVDARQVLNEAQRSECEGLLARARTFIGSYQLTTAPSTAQVTLDGANLVRGQDGLVLVPFGDHLLRVTADGHRETTLRLRVQGGERAELNIALELDDAEEAAVSALPPSSDAPGPVAVSTSNQPVDAPQSGSEPKRSFKGSGLRYTWIALGASAALGAASATFWYLGQGKVTDLAARCEERAARVSPCERSDTNIDAIQRYERATSAALGLSAAALVTAGALFYFEWPREKKLSVAVGLQQFSLRGSF